MIMNGIKSDLIRTIQEGDEVPNYSDSSDAEDEVVNNSFFLLYSLL